MNKYLLFIWIGAFILINTLSVRAQPPANYYQTAEGKTGFELKTALHNIIKAHTEQTYSSLWEHFKTTDAKPNCQVWDIYTDIPEGTSVYQFTFITNQCGNYAAGGDCYNREHSWSKSWFNDAYPMYSDLFHIYPTDGEVATANYTSSNQSKRGPCNNAAYAGIVFEPIDAYKGDVARSYFYMATRYEDIIAGWEKYETNGDVVLNGTASQVFEQWVLNTLFKWHTEDPVSEKEIARNNAIYAIQGNRNPYIDIPEYVGRIWFSSTSINNNLSKALVRIMLNRTSQTITIELASAQFGNMKNLVIHNLSGKALYSEVMSENTLSRTLSYSQLPQGIYLLTITLSDNSIITNKVAIYE
jgi:endonuclease I